MRRLSSGLRGDAGNALVEFTFLGVLLIIPLVYVVLTVFTLQKAAFGVTAATREAGRVYVRAGADPSAAGDAAAAAALAMKDQGIDLPAGQPTITCAPGCWAGATVHVRIDIDVPLPFLPPLFRGRAPASIAVHGRHDEVIDCFADNVPPPPSGAGGCP